MIKPTFVWDLDGTLIDSYPAILGALEVTYAHYGWLFEREQVADYILAYSVAQLLEELADEYQMEKETLKVFYSEELKKRDGDLQLFSEARATLEWTREKGIQNFIYTHKGKNTLHVLSMLGIEEFFEEVLHSQSGFERKPDPAAMNYLVAKYDLDRSHTYYIGDRYLDMTFAIQSGIKSISLTQPASEENLFISSLSEIVQLPLFQKT